MRLYIENDKFVSLSPGDPIRLFPFADLTRNGRTIAFTPELAKRVKLPGFKPAIKLGSHDDTTPAGGSISQLYVGEDGLYAIPEYTDKGKKALEEGDYRYFSPEIFWDGELEDVIEGNIEAPILTGLALLHTPALGGAAALYQAETHKENDMSDAVLEQLEEQKNILQQLPEKFAALFKGSDEDKPDPDEYAAAVKERDEYKAEIERLQTEREAEELRASVQSEFKSEEYGAAFSELGKADGTTEMLASMDEKQREWVLTTIRALSAQIDESKLAGETGAAGEEDAPVGVNAIDAAVQKYAAEHKVDYNSALAAVRKEQPDLFAQENE